MPFLPSFSLGRRRFWRQTPQVASRLSSRLVARDDTHLTFAARYRDGDFTVNAV